MNIISWNLRGLDRPCKWFLVKEFLGIHCTSIYYLQESKQAKTPRLPRDLWGGKPRLVLLHSIYGLCWWLDHRVEQCHFYKTSDSSGHLMPNCEIY